MDPPEVSPEESVPYTPDSLDLLKLAMTIPTVLVQFVYAVRMTRVIADNFKRVLDIVNNSPLDIDAHARLLLFPAFVLAVKTERRTKQAEQIKSRARAILTMSISGIVETTRCDSSVFNDQKGSIKPSIETVKNAISNGRYSDAIKLLVSDGIHPVTQDVLDTLRSKNPLGPTINSSIRFQMSSPFPSEKVLKCVLSFPKGSSGGVFGLNQSILKALVQMFNWDH